MNSELEASGSHDEIHRLSRVKKARMHESQCSNVSILQYIYNANKLFSQRHQPMNHLDTKPS